MTRTLLALGLSLTWSFLFSAMPAAAHELSVVPLQPTAADSIVLHVSGEWPGDSIHPPTLNRTGSLVRLDTWGVLPGVPMDYEAYEYPVSVGQLPPGHYRVEYYVEVFAAPIVSKAPGPSPDAVLEFDVLLAAPSVPTLDGGALALLAAALAVCGLLVLRLSRS